MKVWIITEEEYDNCNSYKHIDSVYTDKDKAFAEKNRLQKKWGLSDYEVEEMEVIE